MCWAVGEGVHAWAIEFGSQNQLGYVARELGSRFFPKSTWFQGLVDIRVEATAAGTVAEEEQLRQRGVHAWNIASSWGGGCCCGVRLE
jgi:hypothetical protein